MQTITHVMVGQSCTTCQGTGKVIGKEMYSTPPMEFQMPCTACIGTGIERRLVTIAEFVAACKQQEKA